MHIWDVGVWGGHINGCHPSIGGKRDLEGKKDFKMVGDLDVRW